MDRPIFLNLFKIHLPLAALVSILHRITGVLFFLGFPLLIYLYQLLPYSKALKLITLSPVKFLIWGLVSLFQYHFFSGVRHLLADSFHWHTLRYANVSSILVLVVSVIMAILAGIMIYGI